MMQRKRSAKAGSKFRVTAGVKRQALAQLVSASAPRARSGRGISSSSVFQNVTRRPELKFLDLNTTALANIGGTGSITLLNGCAQGTDATQHIGRQITMKSLYWIFQGNIATTTTNGGSVRLVILYDKEAEGAAPTIAAAAQTDAFNRDDILAQQNLNNRDRFVVLVDEIIECIGSAGPQGFMRKGYRKVALPVIFNASAAATVAAINTGSVYAFCWQDGMVTTAPVTNLQTRIRFEDA